MNAETGKAKIKNQEPKSAESKGEMEPAFERTRTGGWQGTAPGRLFARIRDRGFSTQVYLIALVVALIGPGLLFTAILLFRYAGTERARFEQDARENVRGIALSIDRDTAGLVSVLQTLATSPRLKDAGVREFRRPGTPRSRNRRARHPPAPTGRAATGQYVGPARGPIAEDRLAFRP